MSNLKKLIERASYEIVNYYCSSDFAFVQWV